MWGMNPHVEIRTRLSHYEWDFNKYDTTTKATASGCGYCKQSAAVAEALNENMFLYKMLIDNTETLKKCYGISSYNRQSRPSFAGGGVGVESLLEVFRILGFGIQSTHGKTFDVYFITKKES